MKQGKLGVKTGEGFFRYTPEEAEKKIKERDRQFLQRIFRGWLITPKKPSGISITMVANLKVLGCKGPGVDCGHASFVKGKYQGFGKSC